MAHEDVGATGSAVWPRFASGGSAFRHRRVPDAHPSAKNVGGSPSLPSAIVGCLVAFAGTMGTGSHAESPVVSPSRSPSQPPPAPHSRFGCHAFTVGSPPSALPRFGDFRSCPASLVSPSSLLEHPLHIVIRFAPRSGCSCGQREGRRLSCQRPLRPRQPSRCLAKLPSSQSRPARKRFPPQSKTTCRRTVASSQKFAIQLHTAGAHSNRQRFFDGERALFSLVKPMGYSKRVLTLFFSSENLHRNAQRNTVK